MSEERVYEKRRGDEIEGAYVLAILYTLGYLAMMGGLMVVDIPTNNRELLLTLVGIMSAAQLGIIKYYYDGSRGAEKAQAAGMARASRTEAVVQDIAKAAAPVTAAAVAASRSEPAAPLVQPAVPLVTPAPENPDTGNIPAAETATQPPKEPPK